MSRTLPPLAAQAARRPALRPVGRRGREGFTLVELTVSLVAGLVVALAVAALSHEASASFNEEIRVSAAEAALRGAADRLRADLTRASFMSTGNIQADNKIGGLALGAANVPGAAPLGIKQLQGLHLLTDTTGTMTTTNGLPLDLVAQNALHPASVDITGNMTSADQFAVESYEQPPTSVGGLPANCCLIKLAVQSDSVFRVLNAAAGTPDPNADVEMRALFQPVAMTNTANQFLVRLVEPNATHSAQYLLTCPGTTRVAGVDQPNTAAAVPFVVTATCPVQATSNDAVGSHCTRCLVNPVQTVRWEIVGSTSTGTQVPAQDVNALDNQSLAASRDPKKYDLVRSFLDSATAQVIPETTEVIAEYAVDMDFALSVDTTADATGQTTQMISYDFGDVNNQAVSDYAKPGVAGPANPDPQRIRSVRFRLATRAAQADRTATIPTTTGPGAGAGTFLYRYCLNPAGCSGNALTQWARVRTVVSEVALSNQSQLFF